MRLSQKALSPRIRALVKISALYSLGERDKAHAIIHRVLKRGDLSPQFFSELFIHLSLFLGYPSLLDGLECVALPSSRRKQTSLRNRSSDDHLRGIRILKRIYGRQTSRLLHRLDELYPGLAHKITRDAYGHIMSRTGLALTERELANVVVLYAHGFDRQLYSHLRGAMRVGISRKDLKVVILAAEKIVGKSSKQTLETIDNMKIV